MNAWQRKLIRFMESDADTINYLAQLCSEYSVTIPEIYAFVLMTKKVNDGKRDGV